VADYYQSPLGEAMALAVPPHGKRVRRRAEAFAEATTRSHAIMRNAAQRDAIDAVTAAHATFAPFLLQGVTASGKTDVYLDAAAKAIAAGGQVLVLVPEINLTPQF